MFSAGWTQLQMQDSAWKEQKTLYSCEQGKTTQNAPSGGKTGGSGKTQKQNALTGKVPWDQDSGRLCQERDALGAGKGRICYSLRKRRKSLWTVPRTQ